MIWFEIFNIALLFIGGIFFMLMTLSRDPYNFLIYSKITMSCSLIKIVSALPMFALFSIAPQWTMYLVWLYTLLCGYICLSYTPEELEMIFKNDK